jgi:membrane-associated HD superfamily phosphohydrolase
VIDIIQQHHGTDTIRFFYEKALKADKHNNGVREEDFRYPGPKPQSREAAVVMVADCIESASRSLTNLTSARLKAVADKLINTRFADGQFDDCDLTLKDLHVIAGSIVRLLTSAHHKRIEYPEQESPELVTNSRFPSAD